MPGAILRLCLALSPLVGMPASTASVVTRCVHGPQASYCQGMAFVTGLLLFYVPEEPAFQLFCRLLRQGWGVGGWVAECRGWYWLALQARRL